MSCKRYRQIRSLCCTVVLCLLLVAASLALAAPQPKELTGAQIKRGGSISIADQRTPAGFDIHRIVDSFVDVILQNVVECLVYDDPTTHEIVPGLATKWTISPDGKTYTFDLRKGVKFHDGTTFNATAVKKTYDRFSDPKIGAANFLRLFGEGYKDTVVIDPYKVQVRFDKPFAPFLTNLGETYCGIVSPATIDKYPDDIGNHIVGTGPFMVKEIAPKDHITLVRNSKYAWAPKFYKHKGTAYLDSITFKHVTEEATRVAALQTGELDIIRAPWLMVKDYRVMAGYYVIPVGNPGPPGRADITCDRWPTDDVNVRKAILYSVNKDEWLKAPFYGGAIWREDGPLTKGFWAYSDKAAKMYEYNPAKAKDLLEQAGWKKNSSGIWEKDGKQLELTITAEATPPFLTSAEILGGQLKEAGMVCKIRSADTQASWAAARKGEGNLMPFATTGTDPDILYATYHSSGIGITNNFVRFKNAELDKLLDEGRVTTDRKKREAIYKQIQEVIMENALSLSVYNSARIYSVNARVGGVYFNNRAGILGFDMYVRK